MSRHNLLLTPFALKGTEIRNRIVSTSHAPGYAEGGMPGERYIAYHEAKARGGIGMTMFGGSSTLSAEVSAIYNQLDLSADSVIPHLRRFAQLIHAHGTRLTCQISHMGRRTSWDDGGWIAPIAPSPVRDPAHHAVPRMMEIEDIERVITAYGEAARRCAEAGLDGVEIMVPSHLPGQFLSPAANRRQDEYGGTLENRMRFLRRILEDIRRRTPTSGFFVSLRLAMDETTEHGPPADECLVVAQRLFAAGLYDLLNLNAIAGSTTKGIATVVGGMAQPLAPFINAVKRFRDAVGAPVLHASRIADLASAAHAISSGAVDLVGMTRAHMADPYIVRKLREGAPERIRPCVGAGYCIDRIYAGREALCLHNPATGRELRLPQEIARSENPGCKVVVVGGGPAGLEAARVAALRGHHVVLFEATGKLGGQVVLAAKASWRRDMIGIADWLASEVQTLGVQIRFNHFAERTDVMGEEPDIVVIATGGVPQAPEIAGADLVQSSWDILSGAAAAGQKVFIQDIEGGHAAVSLADHLARQGRQVTLATADRVIGRSLGGSSYPVYLGDLARAGATLLTDRALARVERHGNRLRVTVRHEYGDVEESHEADTVIAELGTSPNDQLFHELKTSSINRGVTDPDALKTGVPQPWFGERQEGYLLFRVGDAVASREIHAAIYDSLRLLKDL